MKSVRYFLLWTALGVAAAFGQIAGNGGGIAGNRSAAIAATSGSVGGSALTAGTCSSTTVTATGATTSMAVTASPATYPGDGAYWLAYVSAVDTVTVKVCAAVAMTPTASAYNVRVVQ